MESGSPRSLAALQVSAAQRPRSPRPLARCLPSPPPASSLILQAACQKGPGRAQACTRARDSQERPGRPPGEARQQLAAPLRARSARPLQGIYTPPGRAGLPGPPRPRLAPACPAFLILSSSPWTFLLPHSLRPLCPAPTRSALGQALTGGAESGPHSDHTHTQSWPGCLQTAHLQGSWPQARTVQQSPAAERRDSTESQRELLLE